MSEGTVKWFREDLGYGAAIMEDGKSVFLHKRDVVGTLPKQGDVVEFDLYETAKGYTAQNIRILSRA
jgi:CspA family cold shock protein